MKVTKKPPKEKRVVQRIEDSREGKPRYALWLYIPHFVGTVTRKRGDNHNLYEFGGRTYESLDDIDY